MDLAAPGGGAWPLRTAILAGEPDSSPEICDLLKRVDLFRLRPQLTRQVEIVMASVGIGCHFGSALVSKRLFPKRFCPITHAHITLLPPASLAEPGGAGNPGPQGRSCRPWFWW